MNAIFAAADPDYLLYIRPNAEPKLVQFNAWSPSSQVVHWISEGPQEERGWQHCTAFNCVWCLTGDRPGVWYMVPVVDLSDGMGKWLTIARGGYVQIHGAHERFGDKLHEHKFEISREGDVWPKYVLRLAD